MHLPEKREKEYIINLINDMKIRLRDIDDYAEGMKYRKIIKSFIKGFKEEYGE